MATQLAIKEAEAFEKPDNPTVMFMRIISAAMHDERVDVDKLKALLEMKKDFERMEAAKAYHAAMAEFKKTAPQIIKDNHVSYVTKSGMRVEYDHATLYEVCDKVVKALAEHGLSHKWIPRQSRESSMIEVSCVLTHAAGHSGEPTTLIGPPDDSGGKDALKAIASTISILERYTLLAAVGLAAKGQDNESQPNGNGGGKLHNLLEHLDWIANCKDMGELQRFYNEAKAQARSANDQEALKKIIAAKDKRKAELQ